MTSTTAHPTGPIVSTRSGPVEGVTEGGLHVFRGIPYAAPPVADLRWRAPLPHPVWTELRPAKAFGPSAPQAGPRDVEDIVLIGGAPEPTDEDCLSLNIWTTAERAAPLPVMVWLHGGSNRMGAGSLPMYDGSGFARDGVVLVSLNYRLGQLGFFTAPDLVRGDETEANQGLLDQIAALEWVRDNISGFGGDPANVTLFGESAGGLDILALMTIAETKGLFHKAIVQSGGGWLPAQTLQKARQQGADTAAALGIDPPSPEALRQIAPAQLCAVEASFGPVVDGRVLRRDPITAFAKGLAHDIPLMIGVNSGEDSLLNYGGGLERFGKMVRPNRQLARLYPEAKGDHETLIRLGFRDLAFAAPARWIAGRPRRSAAYLYGFDYVETARRDKTQRAPHGSEIGHVFGTLAQWPDQPPAPSAEDLAVSQGLHDHWVQFSKTGRPASNWPAYSSKTDLWMIFNATSGGEVKAGWWKAALDHHSRKGRLLILLIGLRDWLKTPRYRASR